MGTTADDATAAGENAGAEKPKAAPSRKGRPPKGVWGIDLGQCGLKAIRLEERDGTIVATHFDYIEHPKILSQPDADRDQLVREALTQFLQRNKWRGDHISVSVPGKAGLVRFVKLPPVEEKRIRDIVAFEAKQQIPFKLEEVVWDFQKIGTGMVIDGLAIDTEVGLFAMKRDIISKEMQGYRDAKLEVTTIQMAPLALANYLVYDLLKIDPPEPGAEEMGDMGGGGKCVAALDIGADESTLVVTDGGKIIMQRPVNVGGNHFTRALTKDFKLTFGKAEHLKRHAAKGLGKDGPDLKTILTSLKPVLSDLVNELQRALTYFSNTNRNAEIEYLVGLGNAFKLPGLQKYLQDKLGLEVKRPKTFERVDLSEISGQASFSDNFLTYGVAYGLALQGVGRGQIKVTLLPPEIKFERMIRAKKPWAAAAAAVLLLGLGGLAAGSYYQAKPYIDPAVIAEVAKAKSVKGTVDSGIAAFKKIQDDTTAEEKKVKSSVAGQEERNNWLELMMFLNESVPRPDGSNLYAPKAREYYEGWRAPWTEWAKEISDATPERQQVLKQWEANLKTAWMRELRTNNVNDLTLLPLPAYPLPEKDQKLQTVHDLYDRAQKENKRFFRAQKGSDAYDLYRTTQGVVRESAGGELPPGTQDLVQVNIESVTCRYTDKLDNFWNGMLKDKTFNSQKTERVRPRDHLKAAPEGEGWVVELRGYTFHWDEANFVNNAVVDNLAAWGVRTQLVAPPPIAPPADGMPPAEAAAAPAEGVAPPTAGPVVNRLSHFALYSYDLANTSDRSNFKFSQGSFLTSLMGGGAAAAGGAGSGGEGGMPGASMSMGSMGGPGGPGGDAGAGGSPRAGWKPLGGGAGGGSIPGVSGGPPGGGAMMAGGEGGGSMSGPPGSAAPGGAPGAFTPPGKPGSARRTEFVIYFVWKEPKPSDELRDFAAAAAEAGASAKYYSEKAASAVIRPSRQIPFELRTGGLPKGSLPPEPPFEKPAAPPSATPPGSPEGAPVAPGSPAAPGGTPAPAKPAAPGTAPANSVPNEPKPVAPAPGTAPAAPNSPAPMPTNVPPATPPAKPANPSSPPAAPAAPGR